MDNYISAGQETIDEELDWLCDQNFVILEMVA